MNKYNVAKKLTNQKLHALEAHIITIRQRSENIMQRHSDLLKRKRDLTQCNGGSDIKGSDKIHLNVGGTQMHALRETLTKIKGSRLEALFSGRWEDKLLRDEQGRVFLDMDVRYFKKIMDHLHSMKTSKEGNDDEILNWPRLSDKHEQNILDLYIDLFHLRKAGNSNNSHQPSSLDKATNSNNDEGESYVDLPEAVENEAKELDEVEKTLDDMEKELEEEEEFVSFFTTTISQDQGSEKGSDDDSDDGISFASLTSDLGSIVSSTCQQKSNHDITRSPIVNLWIDGEIISVQRSTLCIHKDSYLAENFNDVAWVKKHTVTTEDGTKVVLMGYSSVMLSIINRLRLRSMMVPEDKLPNILEVNRVETVEYVLSKLFPGKEEVALSKMKFLLDSEIVEFKSENDQLVTWLKEVNRTSEPKLLYRASRDGWSTQSFHSRCDDCSHTLVIVETNEGYVFGGYSDQSWGGTSGWKSSSSNFLFSGLEWCHAGFSPSKMKVKSGKEEYAVYVHPEWGPRFGKPDMGIGKNNDMKQLYTNPSSTYEKPSRASNTFLTGKKETGKWIKNIIAEVEVFGV